MMETGKRNGGWRFPIFVWRASIVNLVSGDTFKTGTITLFDQAVSSSTNFLTAVIIGRACTKDEFGLFTLAFALMLFVAGSQGAVLSTPFTVIYPSLSLDDRPRYAAEIQVQQLVFAGCVTVVLAASAVIIGMVHTVSGGLRGLLFVLPTVCAVILLREFLRQFFFATFRMGAASILDISVAVLQLGGLYLLSKFGLLSADSAYIVIGIACGVPALTAFYPRFRSIVDVGFARWDNFRSTWDIGRWALGTHLVVSVGTRAYPWLLAAFHGTAATAEFGACLSIFLLANPFMMGLRNFLMPKFSHNAASGVGTPIEGFVNRTAAFIFLLIGSFTIAVWFCGGLAVEWLFSAGYAGNDTVIRILAIATMAWSLTTPHAIALVALKRPDIQLYSQLSSVLITMTLGSLLVIRFGVLGAAIAILISDTTAALVRLIAFNRIVKKL